MHKFVNSLPAPQVLGLKKLIQAPKKTSFSKIIDTFNFRPEKVSNFCVNFQPSFAKAPARHQSAPGFVTEASKEFAKDDPKCKAAFVKLKDRETSFGWEEPLVAKML